VSSETEDTDLVDTSTAAADPSGKVRVKDKQEVWDQYNAGWKPYLETAEAAYASEGQNLPRILNACLAKRASGSTRRGKYPPRIGGEVLSERLSPATHLAFYMSVVMEVLSARIPPSTQRVVEMGSGWGAVISSLWLFGAPRDAEYWALEYTESGRQTSDLLARSESRFNLKSRAFDYHEPDFSFLTEPLETVVYSTYSIEQITFIKDELIDRIMAIPGFTRCVHLEPVGWQVEPDGFMARLDRLAKAVGLKPLTQATAAARRCWRHGKNRNLIQTLRRYEQAGKIVIEKIDHNLVAHQPLNPGTLVVWRKA
jgi:hypothetical protein